MIVSYFTRRVYAWNAVNRLKLINIRLFDILRWIFGWGDDRRCDTKLAIRTRVLDVSMDTRERRKRNSWGTKGTRLDGAGSEYGRRDASSSPRQCRSNDSRVVLSPFTAKYSSRSLFSPLFPSLRYAHVYKYTYICTHVCDGCYESGVTRVRNSSFRNNFVALEDVFLRKDISSL